MYSVGRARMVRQAVAALLGLVAPCRHRRQSIAGLRLASGVHEMFLVCSGCGKRVSPGVQLGADVCDAETAATPSTAGLATTKWLPG